MLRFLMSASFGAENRDHFSLPWPFGFARCASPSCERQYPWAHTAFFMPEAVSAVTEKTFLPYKGL